MAEARNAYRIRRERFEHPAGSIVYRCAGWDYGCANDDTRATNIEHVSVTLDPTSAYPFFTIAKADLEPVEEPPHAT